MKRTIPDLKTANKMVAEAVRLYNGKRLHRSLKMQTPNQAHTYKIISMQPIEKKKRLHKMKAGMLIGRAAFLKMPAKTYQCSGTFVEITEQFFITENGQPISGRDAFIIIATLGNKIYIRIFFAFVFAFPVSLCFGQDTLFKRFQHTRKKQKIFCLKEINNRNDKEYFYFLKKTNQLDSYARLFKDMKDDLNGGWTKYFFTNQQLVYIIRLPPRPNEKIPRGGIYYYENSKLIEKSEMNVEDNDPSRFLIDVASILEKAKILLQRKNRK